MPLLAGSDDSGDSAVNLTVTNAKVNLAVGTQCLFQKDAASGRRYDFGMTVRQKHVAFQIHAGGAHGCALTPRDVLAPALRDGASAIVLIHNHPSGDPTPSPEDVVMTRAVADACPAAVATAAPRTHATATTMARAPSRCEPSINIPPPGPPASD